jgi:hypothetical protein
MQKTTRTFAVPGLLTVLSLVLAAGAGAATPPPASAPVATKGTSSSPMANHPMTVEPTAKQEADMKAECKAMVAEEKDLQGKFQAMDVTLDKLVAEMNAAKTSKTPGALEKPMAALLTELVAQRKASRTLMATADQSRTTHRMHHMAMQGGHAGMEGCPMMTLDTVADAKADAKKGKI